LQSERATRSRARTRTLPALQRLDGMAPRDLAVPALPVQARLLRGRLAGGVRPFRVSLV